jgi:hypothetical protein
VGLSQWASCPSWSWNHDLQPPHKTRGSSWGDDFMSILVHFKCDSEMWVVKECAEWLIDWHPIGYQLLYHQAQDTSTDQNVMLLQGTHSATYMIVVFACTWQLVYFFVPPNFVMLLKWWPSIVYLAKFGNIQNMKVNHLKHLFHIVGNCDFLDAFFN